MKNPAEKIIARMEDVIEGLRRTHALLERELLAAQKENRMLRDCIKVIMPIKPKQKKGEKKEQR